MFILEKVARLSATAPYKPRRLVGNSGACGHLDQAGDQIYNSAPRLTLSDSILHASGATAVLADEWLHARIHQQPARTASAATSARAAGVLHNLTFSGNPSQTGSRRPSKFPYS